MPSKKENFIFILHRMRGGKVRQHNDSNYATDQKMFAITWPHYTT